MKNNVCCKRSGKVLVFVMALLAGISLPVAAQKAKAKAKGAATVTVVMSQKDSDINLILYKPGNKLTMADFKSAPDLRSDGVAATYSGINMAMEGQSVNGDVTLTVTITAYFDPRKSWMKKEGRTERVLSHEQLHFDLTVMKACELVKAIREGKYTAQDVQTRIRALQAAHTRDLGRLQAAYDKETKHGTLSDKQAQWAERIAAGLAASACM